MLLTGASGFVGSAVARALVAAGYPVRALVRAPAARPSLAGLPIELVEGDIRDAKAVAARRPAAPATSCMRRPIIGGETPTPPELRADPTWKARAS